MRDAETPLLLWVCAAVCAHYVFAQGGSHVARVSDDHAAIARLARSARDRLRTSNQTFEVSTLDEGTKAVEKEPQNPAPPPAPKPEPKTAKADPPKPKVESEKKAVAVVADDGKTPPPPPELLNDKRIAVKQHVKDKKQQDNPNARFLGDEANHVQEETAATQTAHDQDDPNPTPAGNHAGPHETAGDGDRTKIADSEDHAGEKDRAPGERGAELEAQKDPPPEHAQAVASIVGPKADQLPQAGGDGRTPSSNANAPTVPELAPGGAGPSAPDVHTVEGGSWSFNPIRPTPAPGAQREAGPGQARTKPNAAGKSQLSWLGLGGAPGAGQVNLNLSHQGVVTAVGVDQLRKEREADGERRRSEHRGSWQASNFERWRSAIENYVSSVKPGNQTALNTAQSPFATYLVGMHNRIHPLFAESFLGSLEGLPKQHPLNDLKLVTHLEIVLTREGRLVKMGIVRTSGITAFDIAALDSVQRASPFGPAPSAIVSTDGNVYLHWQFHRDEVLACSTMGARPYLLNVPAKPSAPEPETPGSPPPPSRERGLPPVNSPDSREGQLAPELRALRKSG